MVGGEPTPEAPEEGAGELGADSPRFPRLRRGLGLANISTGAGAASFLLTIAVFIATPSGMVVLGWFALLSLVTVYESWANPGTRTSSGCLLGAGTLILLGVAWVQALGWLAEAPFPYWMGTAGIAAGMLYLGVRGFQRAARRPNPELASPAPAEGVILVTVGLAAGVCLGLFLCLDEGPGRFAGLQVERPQVAPEENGFVVLREMMARFPIGKEEDRRIGEVYAEALKPMAQREETWAEDAKLLLQEWQPARQELERVLARPGFAPPASESPLHPWLHYLRDLSLLQAVESRLSLLRGHTGRAHRAVRRMRGVGARLVRSAPDMESYLVASATLSRSFQEYRHFGRSQGVQRQTLLRAVRGLELEGSLREGFRWAISGEVREFRRKVDLIEEGRWPHFKEREDSPFRLVRAFLHAPLRPFLKVNMTANARRRRMANLIDGLDRYRPRERFTFEIDGLGELAAEPGHFTFARNPLGQMLAQAMAPAYGVLLETHFRTLADMRTTQLLLTLRSYQLEHSRLPERLADLMPDYLEELPLDPFTREPFLYEPKGDPPCIASVGPDQQRDPPEVEEGDDIVYELSFPLPAR